VQVRNYGTSPVSFRVRLRIGDWTDSAQVSGLQPAAAREVSFRPWTCPDSGVCVLRCSTELSGDEYHANDTCTAAVVVRYHDAALLEILVPADTVDSGTFVRPQVRVRNNGTQPETFILTFRIPDEGYSRPAQLTVAPDTACTALFPPWVPHLLGDHAMSCTLALAPDQNPSNNLLSGLVTVRPDVGVEEARAVAAFSFDVPSPLTAGSDVTARLCLPGTGPVALTLYNAAGRLVAAPVRRLAAAGRQQMDIPSAELSCGAYLLRLDAPGRSATRRVLIVR
jgi:hypothetical protein